MSGRIKIYSKNWDSPWRWNVMMSLNCWIIKSHTITFAGILNSTIQGKSLSCFLLLRCLWASERQQEGTSPEELFINAPVISFDLHFFWKKKKRRRRCSFHHFSKHCMCVQAGLDFCFSIVLLGILLFCLILTAKSISLYTCGYSWIHFHQQIRYQLWRGN